MTIIGIYQVFLIEGHGVGNTFDGVCVDIVDVDKELLGETNKHKLNYR